MAVVVVESPAKAKTIEKYLGEGYRVLASYGHVRDLPEKDGSVEPEKGFAMRWEVDRRSQQHLRAIAEALEQDRRLILATDPDREGEAISWHLLEVLRKRRAVRPDTKVERVVFNAITEQAVSEAMRRPREIDMHLVEAYLARRALDYLVGFTLSPVLWRKVPGGAKSAGRVQSVALRLIVDRELEIESFRPQEYWTVEALLETPDGARFTARLVALDGRRLGRFDLGDAEKARAAAAAVEAAALAVRSVEAKPVTRNPDPPFMTSTLQQEAARRLGFSPEHTMRVAQKLYESGHITYMRTDGLDMAPEAIRAARDVIRARFGADYVPESPRRYKSKAKNAQEAHECIRPTHLEAEPGRLPLQGDEARLYDLIWRRTLASQMAPARFERTTVEIADEAGRVGLRASGQVPVFDGFLRVWQEMPGTATAAEREDKADKADGEDEDAAIDRRLPPLAEGERLRTLSVTPEQHFTQPPPRYTEATLVRRLEELGIGRPSTYASIVATIQKRSYVEKHKGRLHPTDKGRLVTAFLENYFRRYVSDDFTARMEEELDEVSGGRADWKALLERFWADFSAAVRETEGLRIGDVLETITEFLAPHLFPPRDDGADPRTCPKCGEGRLQLKTARSGGAFLGCSRYPECDFTRPLSPPGEDEAAYPKLLGHHRGEPVSLRKGPYGLYVQLGEGAEPKRVSVPRGMEDELDLARAVALLALPRVIGPHPETGEPVEAGVGRYGPYVRYGTTYANLEKGDDVLTVGMNRALELLARRERRAGRRNSNTVLRTLGEHPEGGAIELLDGRYGPYVRCGKTNASLPRGADPAALSLEEATALIDEKRRAGTGRRAGGSAKGAKAKGGKAKGGKAKGGKAKGAEAKGTKTAKGGKSEKAAEAGTKAGSNAGAKAARAKARAAE